MNAQLTKPMQTYKFGPYYFRGRISPPSVKIIQKLVGKVHTGDLPVCSFFDVARAFGLKPGK
jgi:hypothetical protein